MADVKNISSLIAGQFPDFYREEGPIFVEFVKEYYSWMEQKTSRRNKLLKPKISSIAVTHNSANVIGTRTNFLTEFANGDTIAITRSDDDYEIFTIDTVANNTFLTLTPAKLPEFALLSTTYGNVVSGANPGHYVRRTRDAVDIDETTDEFLVHFKQAYLKNIQFNTVTDQRRLIKNSLDLYRSKGTPRSIDLLFKAAFGVAADVYYPSIDLFRPSSGIWERPEYLELKPQELNTRLVNHQIVGKTSGATCFVDSLIRRTVKNRIIDIAYISNIQGNFQTGERVDTEDGRIGVENAPFITGSLNSIIITNGASGFSIGNTVTLTSNTGDGARARVANTANATGSLVVTLTNGGYAYTNTATALISNNILTLIDFNANTTFANNDFFIDLEQVEQPIANIIYTAATVTPSIGDDIFAYHANGDVKGTGAILDIIPASATDGEIEVKILSGNLDHTTYYTTSNASNFTLSTFTDKTVTANVTGMYANVRLQVSSVSGTFTNGEIITGTSGGNGLFSVLANPIGGNSTIFVANTTDAFFSGDTLTGANSSVTATINRVDIDLGVHDVSSSLGFFNTANNLLKLNRSESNASILAISAGTGFTFGFSEDMLFTEFVGINSDLLRDYANVALSATAYGFPADPAGNATSNTIANLLSTANTKIGKIQTLTGVSPGQNYNKIPITRIYDSLMIANPKLGRQILEYDAATGSFSVGEELTQASSFYRAKLVSSNSTHLIVERLRYDDDKNAVVTIANSSLLVGSDSGSSANVMSITEQTTSKRMADNAEFDLAGSIANGIITELQITDSGFGFANNESVTIDGIGTGRANVATHGVATGFYKSRDGFLSNIKKLQDGVYWQTHSYEVRASVTLDKYQDMLRQVVHVAGTQYFGNLVFTTSLDATINNTTDIGQNTVIISTIDLLSMTDRRGDFIFDKFGSYITTRV